MAIFGFGQQDPYAEAQQAAQDRQTAFAGIKDNLPALGLIAGLSMLARNNGSRSVGQLVGQAGADALNAYGTWQKLEEARQRQKMLDEERKEEREYGRTQDAFRNDMAERKLAMEQARMAQDMQIARQRLGLAQASHALARQNALAGNYELIGNGTAVMDKKTGKITMLSEEQQKQLQAAGLGSAGYDPNDPAVKKFTEKLAEKGAADYEKMQAAFDTLGKMDQLRKIVDSGLYTGIGGDFVQSMRRAGAALGISDTQAAANGETMAKIGNELALMARNPDSGMGMPGAMSDKDREFLVAMQPGLNKSTEGNRLMIEMTRRIAQRRVDIANLADKYVRDKGKLDSGFYSMVREYSTKNGMFDDLGGGRKKDRKPLSSFGG